VLEMMITFALVKEKLERIPQEDGLHEETKKNTREH